MVFRMARGHSNSVHETTANVSSFSSPVARQQPTPHRLRRPESRTGGHEGGGCLCRPAAPRDLATRRRPGAFCRASQTCRLSDLAPTAHTARSTCPINTTRPNARKRTREQLADFAAAIGAQARPPSADPGRSRGSLEIVARKVRMPCYAPGDGSSPGVCPSRPWPPPANRICWPARPPAPRQLARPR